MKLSLGTAQFGSRYGVANGQGQISYDEAVTVIETARLGGVRTLDTAVSYGVAERVLGEVGIEDFDCVTKLPALPQGVDDFDAWVIEQLSGSIGRLGVSHLNAVLLHHPGDVLGEHGSKYVRALRIAQDKGYVENIGFSIYAPEILDDLTKALWPDIIQAPLNVFDQRISLSGWLDRLVDGGVEIHTRSAFLQGLLLMPAVKRPSYFNDWKDHLARWDELVASKADSPMALALNYVVADRRVDRVVVGVDNSSQLTELINSYDSGISDDLSFLHTSATGLIDPSLWNLI